MSITVDDAGSLPEERVAAVRAYLIAGAGKPPPPPIKGGALLRRAPSWAPRAVRNVGTRALRSHSKRLAVEAQRRSPLRLHLGCGWMYKKGWVNIDLFLTTADIPWNLVTGIPFKTGSADAVFHEHMLEHISRWEGFAFTQECLRVLKPGGILRIGVPDAGMCLDSYANPNDSDWDLDKWPTRMLGVQALFYQSDHRAMYDAVTLILMCRAAGFAEVKRRDFSEGWLQPSPDTPERREGTLYVEARKGSD
ncbi:MAG: class I SAM-dependent methyltransferase [Microbacterium sp.]|uniref:class I SAM-dependent methyltransferase n=1 Tax=Microbacterium sp. TaxID=51671 RepID=UPI003D6E9E69